MISDISECTDVLGQNGLTFHVGEVSGLRDILIFESLESVVRRDSQALNRVMNGIRRRSRYC